jgi:hypothetical protein
METTLTIRLPKKQRDALKRRAAAEKRSDYAVVRELIERENGPRFRLRASAPHRRPA